MACLPSYLSVCVSVYVREGRREGARFLNLLVCLSVTNRGWSGEERRGEERRGEERMERPGGRRGLLRVMCFSHPPFFLHWFLFCFLGGFFFSLFGCLFCSNLSLGQAASQSATVRICFSLHHHGSLMRLGLFGFPFFAFGFPLGLSWFSQGRPVLRTVLTYLP